MCPASNIAFYMPDEVKLALVELKKRKNKKNPWVHYSNKGVICELILDAVKKDGQA